MTHRPAHLVTHRGGSHEAETTLRYFEDMEVDVPHKSPFRPHRLGQFPVIAVEVTPKDIWVHTSGGTLRYPPELCAYSWKPR